MQIHLYGRHRQLEGLANFVVLEPLNLAEYYNAPLRFAKRIQRSLEVLFNDLLFCPLIGALRVGGYPFHPGLVIRNHRSLEPGVAVHIDAGVARHAKKPRLGRHTVEIVVVIPKSDEYFLRHVFRLPAIAEKVHREPVYAVSIPPNRVFKLGRIHVGSWFRVNTGSAARHNLMD